MTWRGTGVPDADLREGQPHACLVGDRPIVLVRVAQEVRALDGVCPHLGGDLGDGTVELGKLVCPLHGATFDAISGEVRADPFGVAPPEGGVAPLGTYPVRVVGGEVEVDVANEDAGASSATA